MEQRQYLSLYYLGLSTVSILFALVVFAIKGNVLFFTLLTVGAVILAGASLYQFGMALMDIKLKNWDKKSIDNNWKGSWEKRESQRSLEKKEFLKKKFP